MTSPAPLPKKLLGRAFYESISSPRHIVAPMVEHSELAWRLLSRRHSPPETLCYTPMFHSRLFASSPVYRTQSFAPNLDGAPATDRPLFVQFCSNTPDDLLDAARLVQGACDAVDLNLGCPQGIARKGNYGAFLQEEPDLVFSMIRTLRDALEIPVTAKIRILDTKEKSLAYAQMVVEAGATVLTVHGRTREQKGHNTGLADWSVLKYIRERLPREVVMFANGNILWHEDVDACIAATGVDGVMSAEGNLHNPAIFSRSKKWEERFPRMDTMAREYLDIIKDQILPHLPLAELLRQEPALRSKKKLNTVFGDANLTPVKSHIFKLWHTLLPRHLEVRNMVGRASTRNMGEDGNPLREYEACLARVEEIIEAELATNPEATGEDGNWIGPDTEVAEDADVSAMEGIEVRRDGKRFMRAVPWYRCQPHYRPLPEEARANGALKGKAIKGETRKAEEEAPAGEAPKQQKKKAKVGGAGGSGSGDEEPKFSAECCF